MTLQEFKAWFDGFTESMSGTPNKKQWARIKERVAHIDGVATTERIFIDRYWPHAYPYWGYLSPSYIHPPYITTCNAHSVQGPPHADIASAWGNQSNVSFSNINDCQTMTMGAAMYALGHAEAMSA